MAAFGAAPALVLLAMLRAAVPLRPRRSALLALLASSALGIVATHFVCSKDGPLHALVWHLTPVLVTAWLGSLAAGRFPRQRLVTELGRLRQ
jgi:hypothetical protein